MLLKAAWVEGNRLRFGHQSLRMTSRHASDEAESSRQQGG